MMIHAQRFAAAFITTGLAAVLIAACGAEVPEDGESVPAVVDEVEQEVGDCCTPTSFCPLGESCCPTTRGRCVATTGRACVNKHNDNHNCGGCGIECPIYETCIGGYCELINP